MRQLAWLNTAPQAAKGAIDTKKSAKPKDADDAPPTRAAALEAKDLELPLPPLEWGGHLVSFLWEVGPVGSGGMGPVPITFGELADWQRACGPELPRWQILALRKLSIAYVAEQHRAGRHDAPAPWTDAERPPRDNSAIARHVRALFR